MRIAVSLLALGILASIGATPFCGSVSTLQETAASNILGIRVANIYDRGVIVTDVDIGSSGRELGISRGDVILEVNGSPVLDTEQFQRLLNGLVAGPASLAVSR